jgi:hypothetical protein
LSNHASFADVLFETERVLEKSEKKVKKGKRYISPTDAGAIVRLTENSA